MVSEYQYTSIKRVLDNLLDHPLLKNVNLDQAVRYTIRFISLHGYSKMYQERLADVPIHEFRGLLPCDLIYIIQIKDLRTGVCLRHMTDDFTPAMVMDNVRNHPEMMPHPSYSVPPPHKDLTNNVRPMDLKPEGPEILNVKAWPWYIPPAWRYLSEPAFKTQGRCLFTSFPEGIVGVSYKAVPVDEEGFPLLIDDETYLACLEAYIKKQVFTYKFDTGDVSGAVLQNAKQDYAYLSGQLRSQFQLPSLSEMEAISRSLTNLIPKMREFDNGYHNLGDREYLRKH